MLDQVFTNCGFRGVKLSDVDYSDHKAIRVLLRADRDDISKYGRGQRINRIKPPTKKQIEAANKTEETLRAIEQGKVRLGDFSIRDCIHGQILTKLERREKW